MKPSLNVLVLSDDDPQLLQIGGLLSCFDVQLMVCRTSQVATNLLQTRKFDLLLADVDIQGAVKLVDMNMTNDRGYHTTVIALANDLTTVFHLLTKSIHFALRKPIAADEIAQVLASACNLILIENRVSFRHAVIIDAEAWALTNGVKRPLSNATCLDISQTGLRIKAADALAKGLTVFVDFRLPRTQEWIHTIGKVVWSDAHGQAGISFRYVLPQEFKRLRDCLNARFPWSKLLAKMPEYLKANRFQIDTFEIPRDVEKKVAEPGSTPEF